MTDKAAQKYGISTHAPAQGATLAVQPGSAHDGISTHAPAQGATNPGCGGSRLWSAFQPTLPHRERPSGKYQCIYRGKISTHAPAQGATFGSFFSSRLQKYFNPRSRTGSDHGINHHIPRIGISTHAPAQGATSGIFCALAKPAGFQPTLPHRERPSPMSAENSGSIFQPTLPHRERLGGRILGCG